MSNVRIFIEFAGHFLPILGDGGIHHVFPVPANCSTINDVAYEILKKYNLQSLAPDGVELKIHNKYKLLARDNITNCIREGDQIHVSPRVIPSKWNDKSPTSSRKRKKPSHHEHNTILPNDDTIITTPPHKKRRLAQSTESVMSNVSSSSSSVTVYSSSDPEDIHHPNQMDKLHDIHELNETVLSHHTPNGNTKPITNPSNDTSDSDSSSDSTSNDDDSDETTAHVHNLNSHEDKDHDENAMDCASISTLNDALKVIEESKRLCSNHTQPEYLRCVKVKDRIKILMDNEWINGTVMHIMNEDHVELLMDNNIDTMHVSLDEMEWEFEPENFVAPRSRKLINNKHRDDVNDANEECDIKQWIEDSGHERIKNNELECDQMIAYKILELVDWEPVYSAYKTGYIMEIKDGVAVIENDKEKQSVRIADLCEMYKLKPKENEIESPERIASLQKVKQQRKARRQRQKQQKVAARCQSM
eukprot:1088638_1